MYEGDDDDDLEELLFGAGVLSDRLSVAAHSLSMKFMAVAAGVYIDLLAIAGAFYLCIAQFEPSFRFGSQIYQAAPLILIFSLYAGFSLCIALHRLSIDRMYMRLARVRLDAAIAEANMFLYDRYSSQTSMPMS